MRKYLVPALLCVLFLVGGFFLGEKAGWYEGCDDVIVLGLSTRGEALPFSLRLQVCELIKENRY